MNKRINFLLNEEHISIDINPGSVLLDFIRQEKKLTGTKEGCREGDCGACAVLAGEVDQLGIKYRVINSCLFPLGNVLNKHIVTIEGLSSTSLSPIQKYFIEEGASQCGFCTPGFIVSLTSYLLNNKNLSFDEAINAVAGNICRCTGYESIKRSIKRLIDNVILSNNNGESHFQSLVNLNLIPKYFLGIELKLREIIINTTEEKPDYSTMTIVGGGTDLFVQNPGEMQNLNINFIADTKYESIKIEGDFCEINGNLTFEQFKDSPLINEYFPGLKEYMNLIASKPIRNSATIAGNIVNASPIGDMTIILLALSSKLKLIHEGIEREIDLKDFYKGYKTLDKKSNEIIDTIRFELPNHNSHFNFEKVSKRTYLDIASVNSAIFLSVEKGIIIKAAISAGGVAPIPLFLKKSSDFLINQKIDIETVKELLNILDSEISPINDVRGSANYKRLLLKQLVKAHFLKLFPETIIFDLLV